MFTPMFLQAKEAEGTETEIPLEIKAKLTELTIELLRPLCVTQLKEVGSNNNSLFYTHWQSFLVL